MYDTHMAWCIPDVSVFHVSWYLFSLDTLPWHCQLWWELWLLYSLLKGRRVWSYLKTRHIFTQSQWKFFCILWWHPSPHFPYQIFFKDITQVLVKPSGLAQFIEHQFTHSLCFMAGPEDGFWLHGTERGRHTWSTSSVYSLRSFCVLCPTWVQSPKPHSDTLRCLTETSSFLYIDSIMPPNSCCGYFWRIMTCSMPMNSYIQRH